MNSTRHFVCNRCGQEFAIPLIMLQEWKGGCPKCSTLDVKFKFDYNPNDPADRAEHPEIITGAGKVIM